MVIRNWNMEIPTFDFHTFSRSGHFENGLKEVMNPKVFLLNYQTDISDTMRRTQNICLYCLGMGVHDDPSKPHEPKAIVSYNFGDIFCQFVDNRFSRMTITFSQPITTYIYHFVYFKGLQYIYIWYTISICLSNKNMCISFQKYCPWYYFYDRVEKKKYAKINFHR